MSPKSQPDKWGNTIKPATSKSYDRHMGHVLHSWIL